MPNGSLVALSQLRKALSDVCDNPEREALLLLTHVLGCDPRLPSAKDITDGQQDTLGNFIERRRAGEPLQYILGEWEFMGVSLSVGEGVLCPRPDSECIVEFAINLLQHHHDAVVLDLCAGTGALGIAIKAFVPPVTVTAVEKYDAAFAYLQRNCKKSGVVPIKCDVEHFYNQLHTDSVDLIVCNPPYIDRADKQALSAEVLFEPHTALFEPSHYFYYKEVCRLYRGCLKQGARLLFEIPTGAQSEIGDIAVGYGFTTENITDYNGTVRGICATYRE